MPGLSAVSSSTDAQIKYMKLPKQFQIYYLPERLLDQPLDMTDPDLLSLFKKRFLKVKLRLPQKPGTYDAIMRVVKAAFLEQKVSVHIDQDKVEFAHFDDDNLTCGSLSFSSSSVSLFLLPPPSLCRRADASVRSGKAVGLRCGRLYTPTRLL
ncbi:hypothetical protein V8E36_008455 [Tilletia maclaganii]